MPPCSSPCTPTACSPTTPTAPLSISRAAEGFPTRALAAGGRRSALLAAADRRGRDPGPLPFAAGDRLSFLAHLRGLPAARWSVAPAAATRWKLHPRRGKISGATP